MDDVNKTKLETEFLDKYGLSDVIEALAEICNLKAEHIRTNWPGCLDQFQAKNWETDAKRLEKLVSGTLN